MSTQAKCTTWSLRQSIQGRPLEINFLVPSSLAAAPKSVQNLPWPWLLFLGGVHGDEIEGVWLMEEVEKKWKNTLPQIPFGIGIWSKVNPDGVAANTRLNGRGVDLNRNLPTSDWTAEVKNPRYPPGTVAASEPENIGLIKLIEQCKPFAILSAHSFSKFQVNVNGPSKEWAERIAKVCGYPVTEDIGYPTPGCLGTYAGKEWGIPTITLEIERGLSKEKVLELHLPVLHETLVYWSERLNNEKH